MTMNTITETWSTTKFTNYRMELEDCFLFCVDKSRLNKIKSYMEENGLTAYKHLPFEKRRQIILAGNIDHCPKYML